MRAFPQPVKLAILPTDFGMSRGVPIQKPLNEERSSWRACPGQLERELEVAAGALTIVAVGFLRFNCGHVRQ